MGAQIKNNFFPSDPRKAEPLAAMQVRNVDKNPAPLKPFDQPLITITFDDGWETTYTDAMPLLQKYGLPSTQYVLSGQQKNFNYLSFKQMRMIKQGGHEIACHSVDHKDLTTLNAKDLQAELTDCKTTLDKELSMNVREFASPYGHEDAVTVKAIKQTFRSERNTAGDIITNAANDQDINLRSNFNPYNIIAVTLRGDTTVAQLQAAIDYTVQHNGWLVLNYHQVDEDNSKFSLTDKLLGEQLEAVSHAPARVATMGQVLDAIKATNAARKE
jgi:peptidoglycan/xylan/chitin deacetylase (PgdA/CDA1 family)